MAGRRPKVKVVRRPGKKPVRKRTPAPAPAQRAKKATPKKAVKVDKKKVVRTTARAAGKSPAAPKTSKRAAPKAAATKKRATKRQAPSGKRQPPLGSRGAPRAPKPATKPKQAAKARRPRVQAPARPQGGKRGLGGLTSAPKHAKKVAPPSAWREKARQERKVRRFQEKGLSRPEALQRIEKNKAAYEKRIARYVQHDGYSRPVARGHARSKEGELGIAKGRWFANEIVTQPPGAKPRRELRKLLLAQFGIEHFEAEKGFVEKQLTRNGQKGPADWHRRKRMYAKVAVHLEMMFGVESNQAYSLMFSP